METVSKRERNINNYLKKLEANSKNIDYVNSFGEKNNLSKDDLNYLIKQGYFKLAIVLSNRNRPGTIEKIEVLDSCDLNKEVS